MFITVDKVSDWRDLQSKVCQLFDEMDYETEIEKIVDLAGRGKKEVDVFVKDPLASHNQIYLIECKHWESQVPQDVVHSFKTVMEGAGASTGFIVSKKGFQSGAYEAAKYTNIQLLTFEELQHLYGCEWFRKRQSKLEVLRRQLASVYECHFEQSSLLPIMNNSKFISNGFGAQLSKFHIWVGDLMLAIASINPKDYLGPEPIRLAQDPTLPFRRTEDWFEIPTVRSYFEIVEAAATKCLAEFDALTKEANERTNKLSPEQFSAQMDKALNQLREEMPIRVLKGKVHDEEYQRLLKLLA